MMKPCIDGEYEGKFEGFGVFVRFMFAEEIKVCEFFLLDIEKRRLRKRRKKGVQGFYIF